MAEQHLGHRARRRGRQPSARDRRHRRLDRRRREDDTKVRWSIPRRLVAPWGRPLGSVSRCCTGPRRRCRPRCGSRAHSFRATIRDRCRARDPGRDAGSCSSAGWLDDWLGDSLTLEPVLIMGYPPIRSAQDPCSSLRARRSTPSSTSGQGRTHDSIVSGHSARRLQWLCCAHGLRGCVGRSRPSRWSWTASRRSSGSSRSCRWSRSTICLEHHSVLPAEQAILVNARIGSGVPAEQAPTRH